VAASRAWSLSCSKTGVGGCCRSPRRRRGAAITPACGGGRPLGDGRAEGVHPRDRGVWGAGFHVGGERIPPGAGGSGSRGGPSQAPPAEGVTAPDGRGGRWCRACGGEVLGTVAPLTTMDWGQEEGDHSERGEGAVGRWKWKGRRVSAGRPVAPTGGGRRETGIDGNVGNPRGCRGGDPRSGRVGSPRGWRGGSPRGGRGGSLRGRRDDSTRGGRGATVPHQGGALGGAEGTIGARRGSGSCSEGEGDGEEPPQGASRPTPPLRLYVR